MFEVICELYRVRVNNFAEMKLVFEQRGDGGSSRWSKKETLLWINANTDSLVELILNFLLLSRALHQAHCTLLNSRGETEIIGGLNPPYL